MPVYNKKSLQTCGACAHFRRHYVLRDGKYFPLAYGHCVFPRRKDRAEGQSCPRWAVSSGPPASAAGPETPPAAGR